MDATNLGHAHPHYNFVVYKQTCSLENIVNYSFNSILFIWIQFNITNGIKNLKMIEQGH